MESEVENKAKGLISTNSNLLSLVIPTYNERNNIERLIKSLFGLPINLEVIIVDDNSPDKTGEIAEELSKEYNVKVVHREGKKGLASAVLEGFSIASGDYIGVMDADFQHPPNLLPSLYEEVANGADIAVASRYVGENGIEKFDFKRTVVSKGAKMLARPFTPVKDSISGYFLLKKDVVDGAKLSPVGYKILLEILVKGRYSKVKEVPYTIQDRLSGHSKLDHSVVFSYLNHLVKLSTYKVLNGMKSSGQ